MLKRYSEETGTTVMFGMAWNELVQWRLPGKSETETRGLEAAER
jgi:hypothetical protein